MVLATTSGCVLLWDVVGFSWWSVGVCLMAVRAFFSFLAATAVGRLSVWWLLIFFEVMEGVRAAVSRFFYSFMNVPACLWLLRRLLEKSADRLIEQLPKDGATVDLQPFFSCLVSSSIRKLRRSLIY